MAAKFLHTICLDFDGTCVTHDFPYIGKDIGAVPVLRKLAKAGHRFILLTMRFEDTLVDAVAWCREHDIPLFAVNHNPEQIAWTTSPKIYGTAIIDDTAIGTPLKWDVELSIRPFVDWTVMNRLFIERGFYDAND